MLQLSVFAIALMPWLRSQPVKYQYSSTVASKFPWRKGKTQRRDVNSIIYFSWAQSVRIIGPERMIWKNYTHVKRMREVLNQVNAGRPSPGHPSIIILAPLCGTCATTTKLPIQPAHCTCYALFWIPSESSALRHYCLPTRDVDGRLVCRIEHVRPTLASCLHLRRSSRSGSASLLHIAIDRDPP